jgi:hypothetical protein
MNREMTEYEIWAINKFGGPSPIEGLKKYLNYLRINSGQVALPVQLAAVAKEIGLNPAPIYDKLPFTSCLSARDGVLRIILHRPSGQTITSNSPQLGRYRFSYAHELIHSLGYDLSTVPNSRVAPLPIANEEEILCNQGASHLLAPPDLIAKAIIEKDEVNAHVLEEIARRARISIQVLALQLCEEGVLPHQTGVLYLLSKIGFGSDGKGSKKARCIASLYIDDQGRPHRLLGRNEGLDRIKGAKSSTGKWTLISVHERMQTGGYTAQAKVNGEELVLANKTRVCFTGTHEQLPHSRYVWTRGTLIPCT